MTDESGVIDITNVVSGMKSTFVTWATDFIFAGVSTTPGFQWLTLPVIGTLFKDLIYFIVSYLEGSAVMEAFFINTSIRKSSQALDYVAALNAKTTLPPTASDADYEKAEQNEIAAFNSFVILGN